MFRVTNLTPPAGAPALTPGANLDARTMTRIDPKAGHIPGRAAHSTPGGCQIVVGCVDRTGCHQLIRAFTAGCHCRVSAIGYVEHTGCHQLLGLPPNNGKKVHVSARPQLVF
jgi:hypothetical protein